MQTNRATALAKVEELMILHSARDEDLSKVKIEVRTGLKSLYRPRLERLCQAVNHRG